MREVVFDKEHDLGCFYDPPPPDIDLWALLRRRRNGRKWRERISALSSAPGGVKEKA